MNRCRIHVTIQCHKTPSPYHFHLQFKSACSLGGVRTLAGPDASRSRFTTCLPVATHLLGSDPAHQRRHNPHRLVFTAEVVVEEQEMSKYGPTTIDMEWQPWHHIAKRISPPPPSHPGQRTTVTVLRAKRDFQDSSLPSPTPCMALTKLNLDKSLCIRRPVATNPPFMESLPGRLGREERGEEGGGSENLDSWDFPLPFPYMHLTCACPSLLQ
ncbi:hypothetical protein BX600DRAFT_455382 [Xylariales sp. PMI_506]|nr:hypothetical protein BX600DRAFT_455382 [Xylariales sp. PMI_506]